MTLQGQVDIAVATSAAPHGLEPLSSELAFLVDFGVAPSLLREAVRLAAEAGVEPGTALLANGLVDEDTYFRALAETLDLPFLARFEAAEASLFPESIDAGLAPLAEKHEPLRFVAAPHAGHVARLLSGPPRDGSLAISTPSVLRDAVIARHASGIAAAAADELPNNAAALSFRDATTLGQRRVIAATGVTLGVFMMFNVLAALVLTGSLLALLFIILAHLRILACFQRPAELPGENTNRRPDCELPLYTIVVPLYREHNVVKSLTKALKNLDYPLALLDIKLMTEADDPATQAALRALDLPSAFEIIVSPDGQPRTKPRALNVALPLARGEFLVVYDAEDVPAPDQLRLAVETFARKPASVCCLQARLAIDNSPHGILSRCFAIEYAALFDVINPGLANLNLPIPLGGTSNHFRVDTLRALCGWDAWNVTEDADLGIRLARMGMAVADLPSTTFEEAPNRYPIWRRQRARWMKGFLQTVITHSREPGRTLRELGGTRFAGAVAMTLGTVLAAMLYPIFAGIVLILLASLAMKGIGLEPGTFLPTFSVRAGAHWLAYVAAAIGYVCMVGGLIAMIVPAALGLWRRKWYALIPWLLAMPFYHLLVSFAAWQGLYELIANPSHWNKTEHGLARRRQRP